MSGKSLAARLWSRAFVTIALVAVALSVYLGVRDARSRVPPVTFVSLQGQKITTASLKGRVAMVVFWASDCQPCLREMPALAELYRRYHARGLDLIAVAMQYDPPNYVLAYVRQNPPPFTVALDPLGRLAQAFGNVQVTPTTVVISRRGRIVEQFEGEADFPVLRRLLESELGKTG